MNIDITDTLNVKRAPEISIFIEVLPLEVCNLLH